MSASRRESIYAVFLIILTTILTYGVLISQLGFYRDDWYLLWTHESQGASGLINLFRGDRPFLGWLYIIDFSMLGVSPLGWHIYALIIKILTGLAFFWLMRSLWPTRKIETVFITLLFIVYPGFYQQPNALTFKQLLIAYAAAMLSLALTVQVMKTDNIARKWALTIFALALSAFYIFIYEALIGLEVARFILIGYLLYKQNPKWKDVLWASVQRSLPYFMIGGLFLVWRIFFFQSIRKATNVGVLAGAYASLHGFIRLVVETAKDVVETSVLSWGVPYYQFSARAIYKDVGLAMGLGLLVVLAAVGYYRLAQKQVEAVKETDLDPSPDWLILGLIIVFVTTLPIVAAGRDVVFGFQWDRYTYQSVVGVALVVGGFIFYALRGNLRWIVLGALLMSGVATQVFSAISYRDFWQAQRESWWQLYWRAPQLKDGTTLIASLPGTDQFAEEYEVWAPLNLVYDRGQPLRLSGQVGLQQLLVDLEKGTIEQRIVRGTITVNRDYNHSLITSTPSDVSCLHVYNRSLPDISTTESASIALLVPYSDIGLIEVDGKSPPPPTEIMGAEPEHGWCYFYQKINLALQSADWAKAAKLAEDARLADVQPQDQAEWLPVLESYANHVDEKDARRTATYITDNNTRLYLCQQLKKVITWPDGYRSDIILRVLCNVN